MRYHDFDLSIEEGPDNTLVLRSVCEAHGEYTETVTLDAATMAQAREILTRDGVPHDLLMEFGRQLYALTFAAGKRSLEWHFAQCWGAAGSGDTGVRLRLRVTSPELAIVPWEVIYSDRLHCYFSVSDRTPIVRYLELPRLIPSLEATLPLRILVVIPDQPDLETEKEEEALRDALKALDGVVELTVLRGRIGRRDVADALETREYHVLHFIGHGDFADDKAILVLKNHDGGDEYVEAERVAGLFRNHPSMKLIVLNSCRGGMSSATKPLVGMAAELVRAGIPSVIAMQEEIVDAQAVCFAHAFYHALFLNRDKGRVDIAISHARNALAEDFPDTRAVGLPVLFTHAREGVLFNLEQGSPLRDLSVQSADRVKAIIRTHEQNLELIRSAASDGDAAGSTRPTTRGVSRSISAAELAESRALDRARQRLRFRNWSIVQAVAIALALCFGATWFGFLRVTQWFQPAAYVVAFTDLFERHESDAAVLLVATDSATEAVLGPQTAARRRFTARVINRLVADGAPVIALNLDFLAAPAFRAETDSLLVALQNAAAHNTVVLAAAPDASAPEHTEPALVPLLLLGTNCADTSSLASKSAPFSAPVMTLMSEHGASGQRTPSLPLAAVAAFRVAMAHAGRGPEGGALAADPTSQLLRQVSLDTLVAPHGDPACRFRSGDRMYRLAIEFASRNEHERQARHVSFRQAMDTVPLGDLRRQLVLVGYWTDQRDFPMFRGLHLERRSNLEVEEDAMNTVLRGIRIAPIGQWSQYLVILLMAGLGALAAYLRAMFGSTFCLVSIFAVVVVYFLMGAALYASRHALLNTTFDLAALSLAFLAVSLTRRAWFP